TWHSRSLCASPALDAGGREAAGDGQRYRNCCPPRTAYCHGLHSPAKAGHPESVLAAPIRPRTLSPQVTHELISCREMPTPSKPRSGERWTLAELKQLGKVPDSVLAGCTGRTIKEIVAERE